MTEPDRPSNFDPRDAWNDFRASRFMFQAVIMGLMLLALVVSALVLPFGVTLLLAIASVPLLGFSVRRTLANWRDEDLRQPYVRRPLEQELIVPSDWLRSSSILGKGENAYYEHRRSGYDLWAMLPTPIASFSLGLWLVLHDLANLASLLVAVAVIAIYVLTRSARFFTLLWSRLRRRLRNLSITLLGTVLLITLSFAIPIVPWVGIAAIGLPVYWSSHLDHLRHH